MEKSCDNCYLSYNGCAVVDGCCYDGCGYKPDYPILERENAELKQQLEKLQNKKLAEEEQALERACEWMNIYDLKLHETRSADDFFITRVPGGWIYTHCVWDRKTDNPIFGSSVFVPYTTNLKGPRWE